MDDRNAPRAIDRLRALEAAEKGRAAADVDAPAPVKRRRGVIGTICAAVALVVLKLKGLLLVLLSKLGLVVLALSKFFVTAWTMALMVWIYAGMYGAAFAAGLVGLILVHELGHGVAARVVGVPVGAPIFIPFFGAFIAMKGRPRTAWQEHVIAAAGPVTGGLAAGACVAAGVAGVGPEHLLVVVGYVALIVNLFNLTPFWQLDGARMLKAVEWRAGLVGVGIVAVVVLAAAAATHHAHPIALIGIAVAIGQLLRRRHRDGDAAPTRALDRLTAQAEAAAAPAAATTRESQLAIAIYATVFSALAVAVHVVHAMLPAVP